MAAFEYKALDPRGRQKSGVMEGDSARQVRQLLREQGLTPDGIAGSNTLLRLNVVAGEPMPRLEDESLRASTPVDLDTVADDAMDPLVEEAS